MMIYLKHFSIPSSCDRKEKHQIEHEAGLSLLKEGLLQEFGLKIRDISAAVKAGERGKPYLFQYPDIHFNISHSGRAAVCAVGKNVLGVDVELVRPVKRPSFRRILTEGERQRLDHCPAKERDREFFRIWTLKESYAKALGSGLGMDFTCVEFPLQPVGENLWEARVRQLPEDAYEKTGWKLAQTIRKAGEEEYVVSVCGLEEDLSGDIWSSTDFRNSC